MSGEVAPLLVNDREAARLLGVCAKTIYLLTKRGELPAVRIGRAVRYDVQDLRGFVQRTKLAEEMLQDCRNKNSRNRVRRLRRWRKGMMESYNAIKSAARIGARLNPRRREIVQRVYERLLDFFAHVREV